MLSKTEKLWVVGKMELGSLSKLRNPRSKGRLKYISSTSREDDLIRADRLNTRRPRKTWVEKMTQGFLSKINQNNSDRKQ